MSIFLDSSEQHPLDLRTRVGYGFPTIDDLEIDAETEPIDLDDLSVTRETEILRAPPGAALPTHEIMEQQRRLVDTSTSVIHITISSREFCEQPNHFHR